MADFDLVIRGGTVADGTGAELQTADIAVTDGVIAAVGRFDGRGRREIQADGALVAPGWVDVHTHYDGQAVWDSALAPSSTNGVTTVVFGNCGVGFAPVKPDEHEALVELMEGVEDIPGTALHEGLTWEWESFPEYLDALDRIPHDIDFAAQVPHAALRLYAMGERACTDATATADEIDLMATLTEQALFAGALGLSTSRTPVHRSISGQVTPSLAATLEELSGIAAGMRRAGRGVIQLVSEFADLDVEWPIVLALAEVSGRPVSMTVAEQFVMQPTETSPTGADVLARIDEARRRGIPLTAQVAPRPIGIVLGLQATLHPFMSSPVFQQIQSLPLAEIVAKLATGETRARLLDSFSEARENGRFGSGIADQFERMVSLGDPPDYEQGRESTVAAIARALGKAPQEVALDVLLENGGTGLLYLPFNNYSQWNLDSVRSMLAHPWAVPGLSDGGAHVGTICDASFPTFLLSYWGYQRRRGERLPVPFLIERQTRATANVVGLHDRGVIAPGYRADINVIDAERLASRAPSIHADLPAGGRRFLQAADGYLHTFVKGIETYADGIATGSQPGKLIRGQQPHSEL